MANQDKPFGLRPLRYASSGAPYTGGGTKYAIPAAYATALFVGDPVVKVATANTAVIETGTERHEIGTLMEINKATAGDNNPIVGVIVDFEPIATSLDGAPQSAASTAGVAVVADDPDLIFEIQADGAVGAASVGLNAVTIFTHAGDTTTGLSGVELDTTSDAPAADASNQLLIVGLSKDPNNQDGSAANTNVEVMISRHQHRPIDGILGV